MNDYFLDLEVHILASDDMIKNAYRKLCQKHHPDNGGNHETLLRIKEAYEVLSDPARREHYIRYWMSQQTALIGTVAASGYTFEELLLIPLKNLVDEYMFYIMSKEYESAYELLSMQNKRRVFKKDFILWQRLISEVHELVEYTTSYLELTTFEDPKGNEVDDHKTVVFKVDVKEYNHLLERIEEDSFLRFVKFEQGQWKIRLNDRNIDSTIKKYKHLLVVHKRRSKHTKKLLASSENPFPTKDVSFDTLLKSCEYEYRRFLRYQRKFCLVLLDVSQVLSENDKTLFLKQVVQHIRTTDSMCEFGKHCFLILLTETKKNDAITFCRKINSLIQKESDPPGLKIRFKLLEVKEYTYGIKEMIDAITRTVPLDE